MPSNVTLIAGNNLILKGDLQNYGDIVFNNNGNLQANIVLNENSGLISSSGNLNITTNALINENGAIYADNSLSLNTPVIYNSGTVEASLGNVNIASANNLDITGTANSIIESNSSNINLNSSSSSLSNGLNLAFGNYLSKELNLDANQGYINAGLNNVTGQINSQGDSEHIFTQSADMIIGNSNIKGDPTYDSTGNISLDGAIATNGSNLAIVAGFDIGVTSGSTTSINTTVTSSGGGNGGNVVMIAGVGNNLTGYSNQTPTVTPGLAGETSTISVTLGATSGNAGGNIDLSTGNSLGNGNFVIYTNGTGTNGNGGNVTLVAQASGSTGGGVLVSDSTQGYFVNTEGVGTGSNGNVLFIATGNSGNPSAPYMDIEASYITTGTYTSTSADGSVSLYIANPTNQTVTFDNTGTIGTGQSITANTASLIPGVISVYNTIQTPTSNGSNVTLETGLASGVGISGGGPVIGDNVYLTTSGADIGSASNNVLVGGTNLTVNTNAIGSVYLSSAISGLTNSLSINSWTGDNFSFTSTVNGQPVILAGNLIGNSTSGTISITSGIGDVTFDGNISADTVSISVNAGSLIENSTTAVITSTGNSLSLSASSSIGSSSQSVLTNSGTINLTEIANSSNTYIQNNYTGGQQLSIAYNSNVTTLGTFDYSFASNLTINNNIETASTINLSGLSTDNAGIAIGSNLLAATTSITLAASGSGNITEASGNFTTLQTPDLILSSGTGSIGTLSIPIFAYTTGSPTSTVTANTGGTGNVYLEISPEYTSGTITFNASTAGGTFSDYGSGNSIIVDGNIVAPVISLGGNVSSIFNTSLTLNASVIGSTSVSLYALNAGSIIQSSTSDAISAPTVNLITVSNTLPPPPYGSSNIGSATTPLVVSNVSTALNVGTTGAVYISSSQSVALGNIGASSSMPSSFQLTSSGDITSAGSSYMAYAGSITLTANGSNGVGATNSYVNVNTANLTVLANAATTSSAYINDAYSGGTAITLGTGNPSITIGSSGTLGFEASNNAILIGASISANEIDLTAKGTITQSLATDILTAGTINLQTYGSAIGSTGTNLFVSTSNIGVNTTLGSSTASASAYISDSTGPVTIGTTLIPASSLGTSGTYSLTETANNGEIIIAGSVTAGTIDLTSTSSGTGSIGGIQEASAGVGTLSATNVTLTDTGTGTGTNAENIGATGSSSTGSILTQTANLAVTTTLGSAYVSNTGAVTLGASSVDTTGTFSLASSGSIAVSGNVSAGIATGSGTIDLTSDTTTGTGSTAGITSGASNVLTAGTINLNTNGSDIGGSSQGINVDTANISFSTLNNSSTTGNAYINDTATSLVNLDASSVGSTNNVLDVTFNGSVVINGLVTAGSATSSGSINLALTGNGTVTDAGNLDILQAGTVNFNTAGGNIGGQFAVLVDTSNVSVNTLNSGATTGYAYITDSAANLNINSSSVSTQTYSSTSLSMYITNSGNININGSLSSGTPLGTGSIGIACLNSNASVTDSSSILTAGLVHIQTAGGNIGSSGQNILINANNFNITTLTGSSTTGSAFISDSSTATINLGNISHVIDVGSSGILSLTATQASINVAGNLAVGSVTGSGTIDLTVTGTNTITQSSTSDLLTAGTVNLKAGSSNFGTSATSLFTVASSNLSANTTGSAFIQDNASTTNILASLLGNTLVLNTAGTVNTNGNVEANNIAVNTANNGYITVNATLGETGANISLNANGAGYITTGTKGLIVGNSLSLVSTDGEIGFNGPGLLTSVNNVVFSSQLSVGINNNSANLNVSTSASNANVYIENSGNITASGTITAPVLGLYSINGTNGIGSSGSLISVNAVNLAMSAFNSKGSAYVNDTYTGNVTVQESITGDILKLDTVSGVLLLGQVIQGTKALPGEISGSIIAIATNGGFGILNATNLNSNDFIFLTASQNGYIAEQGSGNVMDAPNVALVSGGGAIGGANNTGLILNSAKVAASTLGAGSYVNIYDEASNSGINGGQSGSYYTFNSNGNVNIYESVATGAGNGANGGSLSISGNGVINAGVSNSVTLLANSGNIVIQDNNTTSGAIHVYSGDTISTKAIDPSLGSVIFNIGGYTATKGTNPNPSSITVNTTGSGLVYFGAVKN